MDAAKNRARLDATLTQEWDTLLKNSRYVHAIKSGEFDKRLFALHLLETYHYTLHNARNQAVVGINSTDISPQYLQFCFEHAAEESGHELMAIHDLKSMGFKFEIKDLPRPMPNTEVLTGYLYYIGSTGNPLQRLGYSYWAENCYAYINPLLGKLKEKLELRDNQLTFFVAHSSIDEKHAEEVAHTIKTQCKTEKDYDDVERVMVTSLRLTGRMLEDVMDEYAKLVQGKPSPYAFLNDA